MDHQSHVNTNQTHRTSADSAILRQLVLDYRQIVFQYRLPLQMPVIALTETPSLWGRWDPLQRTIELKSQLVYEHSWDTVLYVLKHEMAHQIVNEVFKIADAGHQESFHRACDLLQLPPFFRRGSGDLTKDGSWQNSHGKSDKMTTVIQKIQKLFLLSSSPNPAEAALALERAQELMYRYNVHESLVHESPENFKYIVVDTGKSRLSPIYSHLASLLIEHYNVDVIFTKTFNVSLLKPVQALEIYGRESQVVVAEYVLHYLLRTLEELWQGYSQSKKQRSSYLKKSFQLGILNGFANALKRNKSSQEDSMQGLVATQKSLQIENEERSRFVSSRYPRLNHRTSGRSAIDRISFGAGQSRGQNIDIRSAIQRGRNPRLFLKSKG